MSDFSGRAFPSGRHRFGRVGREDHARSSSHMIRFENMERKLRSVLNGDPKDDMSSNCYLGAFLWRDMSLLSRRIKGNIKLRFSIMSHQNAGWFMKKRYVEGQQRERNGTGNNPEYSGEITSFKTMERVQVLGVSKQATQKRWPVGMLATKIVVLRDP